jgi:hypothetical protein
MILYAVLGHPVVELGRFHRKAFSVVDSPWFKVHKKTFDIIEVFLKCKILTDIIHLNLIFL